MCNQFTVDDWRNDAKLVIIDDVDIKFYPWKPIFGCQREFNASGKYRAVRKLRGGKPAIILCNADMDPRRAVSGAELDWMKVNVVFIEITEPLFTRP